MARVLKDLPHRRRRDPAAEPGQFAVHAPLSPAGIVRAISSTSTRTARDSPGALTWRCSTATRWRKMKTSPSLARSDRANEESSPSTRSTARQANRGVMGAERARTHGSRAAAPPIHSTKETQVSTRNSVLGTYRLRDPIILGRATPSLLVSHELSLDEAPAADEKFDHRADGYTKIFLHPQAHACSMGASGSDASQKAAAWCARAISDLLVRRRTSPSPLSATASMNWFPISRDLARARPKF